MKKRIASIIFAAAMVMAGSAQNTQSGTISPYSQYGLGVLSDQSQGFSRGMNGTGIGLRQGTLVNTLNPASYSAVDSLTMLFDVGLSGQFTNFKEQKVSVNTRSANIDYAVGLFRMRKNLGVSFGLLPFSDVGYSYISSTYLNNSVGTITESYMGSGGLHQAFVGAGWNPVKPLSVGVNFAYVWGSYKRSVASTASQTVNSLSKTYKASINSYNVDFGLQWQQKVGRFDKFVVGTTFGLGHQLGADPSCEIVNVNTSTLVSDTTSFVIKDGLELPMTYGVGLSWEHRQRLTIAADFSQQKWGSVKYPSYDEQSSNYSLKSGLLSDRTRVSLGMDYVPDPFHPSKYIMHVHYRFGVAYATPYYKINGQDGPKELSVSAGLGIPILNKRESRSVLNVSAQWLRASAKDLITENTFRINVSLTFNQRWFAKFRID